MSTQAPALTHTPHALSRLAVIVAYTWRSCFPLKRWAAILLPCLGAMLFGALAHAAPHDADRAFANIAAEGILSLMMPIAALVIGDSVLGAEVRAGTFQFTWLSPAPTWQIVLGRWAGGSIVALITIVPATGLAAVIGGSPDSAAPVMCAAAAGSLAYIAVFIAVGCLTRRTAVWSLALVFLVERLLGEVLTGIAQLSPTWESRATYVGLLDSAPTRLQREGIPQGADAIVRLLIVTVVTLTLAAWRMRHIRLSGASD